MSDYEINLQLLGYMVLILEEMTSSFRSISIDSTTAFTEGLFQLIYVSKNHVHDAFEYRVKKSSVGILSMFYKTEFTLFFQLRFDNIDQVSAPLLRKVFQICFVNKESDKLSGNSYLALERGSPML